MRHLGLKITSVVIAILAWMFVTSDSNITKRQVIIPIEYKNLNSDKVVVSDLNREVRVTVRGPSFLVQRIENSPPVFRVEIPKTTSSSQRIVLQKEALDIPFPLEVTDLDPNTFDVQLDNLIQKKVPIKVALDGAPPKELLLKSVSPEPERVQVKGGERVLRRIKEIETEVLRLDELDFDLTGGAIKIPVSLITPIANVTLDSQAEVSIVTEPVIIKKRFNKILINGETKSFSFEIEGAQGILNKIEILEGTLDAQGKITVPDGQGYKFLRKL